MEVNACVNWSVRLRAWVCLCFSVTLSEHTPVYNNSMIDLPVDASTIERRAIPRVIVAIVYLLKQI